MTKYSEYIKREREREDLSDELTRGTREINKSIKSLEGWSDKVMAAILSPLENNLDKYPLGHKTPNNGNLTKVEWNV